MHFLFADAASTVSRWMIGADDVRFALVGIGSSLFLVHVGRQLVLELVFGPTAASHDQFNRFRTRFMKSGVLALGLGCLIVPLVSFVVTGRF